MLRTVSVVHPVYRVSPELESHQTQSSLADILPHVGHFTAEGSDGEGISFYFSRQKKICEEMFVVSPPHGLQTELGRVTLSLTTGLEDTEHQGSADSQQLECFMSSSG